MSALRDIWLDEKFAEGHQAAGHVLARRPAGEGWPDEDEAQVAAVLAQVIREGSPRIGLSFGQLRDPLVERLAQVVGAEFAATAFALAPDTLPAAGFLWRAATVLLQLVQRTAPADPRAYGGP